MKRLELLDYGRFFAALAIVLFHYTFNGIANGKITSISYIPSVIRFTKYGYLGVEFFFMISGYVILCSAKNSSASEFVVSRAARLYPSYWFSVIFTSCFALNWGGELMSVDAVQVMANLTMFQSLVGIRNVDGVYWFLVPVVSFYGMVFVALLCGLQEDLEKIFLCWPILLCLAFALNIQQLPYLGGYYYFFSAGTIFGVLKGKRSLFASIGLIIIFVMCIIFSLEKAEALSARKHIEHSRYIISAVITLFFLFFIFQHGSGARTFSLPLSKTLGALTYPVILIHAHFGYMFINQFATESNKFAIYPMLVGFVLLVALLMHKVVDVRLSTFWRRIFGLTLGRITMEIQGIAKKMRVAYKSRSSRVDKPGSDLE